MNAVRKAEQDVVREQKRQLRIMNCVVFSILYKMGYDADTIVQRFNEITQVWIECREKRQSTFQILEEETGIELALEGEKSYKEFDQNTYRTRNATIPEYIYSLHRRKRWIAPMILACVLVTLYRIDHWTDEQMEQFIMEDRQIRMECGDNVQTYENYMTRETGYTPREWEEK